MSVGALKSEFKEILKGATVADFIPQTQIVGTDFYSEVYGYVGIVSCSCGEGRHEINFVKPVFLNSENVAEPTIGGAKYVPLLTFYKDVVRGVWYFKDFMDQWPPSAAAYKVVCDRPMTSGHRRNGNLIKCASQ